MSAKIYSQMLYQLSYSRDASKRQQAANMSAYIFQGNPGGSNADPLRALRSSHEKQRGV